MSQVEAGQRLDDPKRLPQENIRLEEVSRQLTRAMGAQKSITLGWETEELSLPVRLPEARMSGASTGDRKQLCTPCYWAMRFKRNS